MNKAKEFVTEGPIIDFENQIYIERPEDTKILNKVRTGKYVALLGARQTGKTSLLYMLRRELKTEIPVLVDLSRFSGVKKDDWYDRVAKTVVRRLPQELRDAIGEANTCADQEQFSNLLREIAEALAGTDRFVLLLDEMGTVPKEIRDDFFGTIRSIYNERGVDEAFQRYIFVLAGATSPAELIDPESRMSPFNISETIYMDDFSLEGVQELGKNLRLHGFKIEDSAIEHIYDWTNGHPNLTQEIFARLVKEEPGKVKKEMIDDSVRKLIAKGCNNLKHISRLMQDEAVNQQVLDILNGKEVPFSLSNPRVLKLYLIGVIGEDAKEECVIRNNVYEIAQLIEKQKQVEEPEKLGPELVDEIDKRVGERIENLFCGLALDNYQGENELETLILKLLVDRGPLTPGQIKVELLIVRIKMAIESLLSKEYIVKKNSICEITETGRNVIQKTAKI